MKSRTAPAATPRVEEVPSAEHDLAAERDHLIEVRSLTKRFVRAGGEVVNAVDDVDLDVSRGEILCLLGPSGCGKTTLLRCIAGLETPSHGEIVLNGQSVYSSGRKRAVPPEKRNISMMFQSYALWPHMSVAKNVAYPLKSRRWPRNKVKERVREVLEIVGISELIDQMPGALSGGQQQRVALARSLGPDPSVILFDEPLSNVDAKVRESLRLEILEMHRRVGFAAIYVTHDQDEAMRLGDRVAVLNQGEIADIGPPERIYTSPRSRYVANFVGSLNELAVTVARRPSGGSLCVDLGGESVELHLSEELQDVSAGDEVILAFRPEQLRIGDAPAAQDAVRLNAVVLETMFLGSEIECLVEFAGQRLTVRTPYNATDVTGDEIKIWCMPKDIKVFCP